MVNYHPGSESSDHPEMSVEPLPSTVQMDTEADQSTTTSDLSPEIASVKNAKNLIAELLVKSPIKPNGVPGARRLAPCLILDAVNFSDFGDKKEKSDCALLRSKKPLNIYKKCDLKLENVLDYEEMLQSDDYLRSLVLPKSKMLADLMKFEPSTARQHKLKMHQIRKTNVMKSVIHPLLDDQYFRIRDCITCTQRQHDKEKNKVFSYPTSEVNPDKLEDAQKIMTDSLKSLHVQMGVAKGFFEKFFLDFLGDIPNDWDNDMSYYKKNLKVVYRLQDSLCPITTVISRVASDQKCTTWWENSGFSMDIIDENGCLVDDGLQVGYTEYMEQECTLNISSEEEGTAAEARETVHADVGVAEIVEDFSVGKDGRTVTETERSDCQMIQESTTGKSEVITKEETVSTTCSETDIVTGHDADVGDEPHDAAPDCAASHDVAPGNVVSHDAAPDNVASRDAAPDNVASRDAAPDNVASRDAAPDNVASRDAAPHYDVPHDAVCKSSGKAANKEAKKEEQKRRVQTTEPMPKKNLSFSSVSDVRSGARGKQSTPAAGRVNRRVSLEQESLSETKKDTGRAATVQPKVTPQAKSASGKLTEKSPMQYRMNTTAQLRANLAKGIGASTAKTGAGTVSSGYGGKTGKAKTPVQEAAAAAGPATTKTNVKENVPPKRSVAAGKETKPGSKK